MFAKKSSERIKNMPKHEFGIMPQAPRLGERFDEYVPEKLACTAGVIQIITKAAQKNLHRL